MVDFDKIRRQIEEDDEFSRDLATRYAEYARHAEEDALNEILDDINKSHPLPERDDPTYIALSQQRLRLRHLAKLQAEEKKLRKKLDNVEAKKERLERSEARYERRLAGHKSSSEDDEDVVVKSESSATQASPPSAMSARPMSGGSGGGDLSDNLSQELGGGKLGKQPQLERAQGDNSIKAEAYNSGGEVDDTEQAEGLLQSTAKDPIKPQLKRAGEVDDTEQAEGLLQSTAKDPIKPQLKRAGEDVSALEVETDKSGVQIDEGEEQAESQRTRKRSRRNF